MDQAGPPKIAQTERAAPRGRIKDSFVTVSGQVIDRTNLKAADFTRLVPDLARAVSKVCRFGGHLPDGLWYSVAEHLVHCSEAFEAENPDADPDILMWLLVHDLIEGAVGDIPSPVKKCFPEYRALEARAEENMASGLGLAWPMPPEIKKTDLRMLATEALGLYGGENAEYWLGFGEPFANVQIPDPRFCVEGTVIRGGLTGKRVFTSDPCAVFERFMERFEDLQARRDLKRRNAPDAGQEGAREVDEASRAHDMAASPSRMTPA